MRGIPANGHSGRGESSSQSRDSDSTNKASTATFRGLDGKSMTFVVSSITEDASVKGGLFSKGHALWKRRDDSSKEDNTELVQDHCTKSEVVDNTKSDELVDNALSEKIVDYGTKRSINRDQDTSPRRTKILVSNDTLSQTATGGSTEPMSSEDYVQKEDEFMLKQELEKSKLRLQGGRGNELDHLLTSDGSITDVEGLFKSTDRDTLLQHLEHIKARLYFCKDARNATFLGALETIIQTRLGGKEAPSEVSDAVSSKIDMILSTKSISELENYQVEIQKKLDSDGVIDTNFWELALSRIPYFKACCVLRDHSSGVTSVPRAGSNEASSAPKATSNTQQVIDKKYERFMQGLKLDTDEHIMRENVPYGSSSGPKPLFAARVTMTYDWNKYNLSHFDMDNPPPKSVQGFKFSIFFSDLEDPRATPQWKLVKDGSSTETCLLVFKGGRPYAPLAFRIPAREWDTDPSRGFKNCFSDGVLHLYFNYRKLVYRR
ncbi:hypothetical protein BaOVIS_028790 [Babesia ovis]|uniref:Splicing factor Cactin n=1 Tax=Babesia ovis TaxID=5869 RepID=A0A9W5TDC5_BABOV|nr:hypothetical protein BaOVIS_028790 [Babesia ovis]